MTPLRKTRHDATLLSTIKARTTTKVPNRPIATAMIENLEQGHTRNRRYVNVRTSGSRVSTLMHRSLAQKSSGNKRSARVISASRKRNPTIIAPPAAGLSAREPASPLLSGGTTLNPSLHKELSLGASKTPGRSTQKHLISPNPY